VYNIVTCQYHASWLWTMLTSSAASAGMRGPSPKKDIHLVVDIVSDADSSEPDACGSPVVSSLLRGSAAASAAAPTAPAEGLGEAPAASPARRQQQSGCAASGSTSLAHGGAWGAVLGGASPAAAAAAGSSTRPAPRSVMQLRAEMAHRLAQEYASQYR
jgi:hypothetical protein